MTFLASRPSHATRALTCCDVTIEAPNMWAGHRKMAAVAPFNISAHLRHLLLSKNQNCLQRLLLLYRRCLGTNSRRYLGPSGNPTTHAPAWQLYSGVCSRARYYSTASVAVAETVSLSPAVKYLVDTNNISDLSLITPSGPKDRILKG